MRRYVLALAALPGLVACAGPGSGPAASESISETRPLSPEGTFRLQNVNGVVEVHTWKEAQVKIEAEKSGSRWVLEQMRIEIKVRGQGDEVSVETHHPRGGWFMGNSGRIDYHVTVPENARIEVQTTNGRVRIEGASGRVRAVTTNGRVEVEDAVGEVEASTTNGGVRVAFRKSPTEGSSRVSTTNGGVVLLLPADASGDFEASTVNGGIRTDFPLEVRGGVGGRRLDGRLGEGRARFELRTINGGVRILRHGSADSAG